MYSDNCKLWKKYFPDLWRITRHRVQIDIDTWRQSVITVPSENVGKAHYVIDGVLRSSVLRISCISGPIH